jgi:hypothetical protein
MISNQTLRNNTLSYHARGVLAFLLTFGKNWIASPSHVAQEGQCGIKLARRAMRELQAAGYLKLVRTKDKQGLYTGGWDEGGLTEEDIERMEQEEDEAEREKEPDLDAAYQHYLQTGR